MSTWTLWIKRSEIKLITTKFLCFHLFPVFFCLCLLMLLYLVNGDSYNYIFTVDFSICFTILNTTFVMLYALPLGWTLLLRSLVLLYFLYLQHTLLLLFFFFNFSQSSFGVSFIYKIWLSFAFLCFSLSNFFFQ